MKKSVIIGIIVIAVATLYFGSGFFGHSSESSISYGYYLEVIPYYEDGNGIHYPSAGNQFINAYITEINTGDERVISLPNCYSLIIENGDRYEWVTGYTDYDDIMPGQAAHVITTFEVPSTSSHGYVEWNFKWVRATLVDL